MLTREHHVVLDPVPFVFVSGYRVFLAITKEVRLDALPP